MAVVESSAAISSKEFLTKFFGAKAVFESIRGNKTIAFSVIIVGGGAVYSLYKKLKGEDTGQEISTITRVVKKDKIQVDKNTEEVNRLWRIGKIVLPSVKSTTFLHLIALTVLLYARTVLSLKVADITGSNAQYIVQQNLRYILLGVIQFGLIGLPASLVNSGLKYETTMLSLKFRKNLTDHVHAEYLRGTNFYKAGNLGGQGRIDNADQRVTQDIQLFSEALSNLYATIFKPLLDVMLNTLRLSSVLGWRGPVFLFLYYLMSGAFKRFIMPAFGRLTARASELEGDYRTAHQRLIANAEEIAFYDGGERERSIISRLFSATYFHARHFAYLQYIVGIFDEFLVKYGASIAGYAILALPVIEGRVRDMNPGDLTNEYVRNRQLLINLAKGIAQLVVLSNKVTSLAGYTARVSELLEQVKVLDEVGVTPFDIVDGVQNSESSTDSSNESFEHNENEEETFLAMWKTRMELQRAERHREAMKRDIEKKKTVAPGAGRFLLGDDIKFDHVTIVNPDGRLLVEDLNFEVPLSTNVVVTGPNGSGKSSLFRVLGELWPLQNGIIVKPGNEEILFVPQKPYLVLGTLFCVLRLRAFLTPSIGTLRDQIIYPHSVDDMKASGVTDSDLEKLLSLVDPTKTILNQWDWDDVRDWFSAFSGGQKQRVGMARLFYHCPKYGILDECTSAVSVEVEGKIYETCEKLGITLFTVSHRASLRKYHKYELHFNGSGGWTWSQISNAQ